MSAAYCLLLSMLQVSQSNVEQGDIQNLLGFGAGVFALVLFLLSLYAWTRRRQPSLLIISGAFFLFFLKEVLQLLPEQTNLSSLVPVAIDFVILAAIFIALVVRPGGKRQSGETDDSTTMEAKGARGPHDASHSDATGPGTRPSTGRGHRLD